jgi:hypothetical protein
MEEKLKEFFQLAWENRNMILTVILAGLIIGIIIHRSNKRYIYIDCKVFIKKPDGSIGIYYHCTRWNSARKNGYVWNEITGNWVKLTKRHRAIIRKAHDENQIPEIHL